VAVAVQFLILLLSALVAQVAVVMLALLAQVDHQEQ
jgi:hypothetical protein